MQLIELLPLTPSLREESEQEMDEEEILRQKENQLEEKLCSRHCKPLVKLFKSLDEIAQIDNAEAFCDDVLTELT